VNIDTFLIAEVMIHDIPRGNDVEEQLILTDDPITLDADLRRYFRQKIVGSLRERGVDVVADLNEDGRVRNEVARIIANPSNLPVASRSIAEHLNVVQSGRNPAGLLAVVCGTVDKKPCVSVLKLEREQGLRFRIETVENRRVVDLEYLRDLTLTDKTKVFKTSLFVLGGGSKDPAARVSGRVSDDQRGNETGIGVATFFLGRFLGCRLRDSPEKKTLAFVTVTDAFINKAVLSPERRGKYQIALLAAMQDQTSEVQARSFADTNLEQSDRPPYLDMVRDAGIDPDIPFPKDVSLVKISGFKMTFESGMVLVGSRNDLQERVEIQSPAHNSGVLVKDAMKTLSGR
jgi:hypothetical protein